MLNFDQNINRIFRYFMKKSFGPPFPIRDSKVIVLKEIRSNEAIIIIIIIDQSFNLSFEKNSSKCISNRIRNIMKTIKL